MTPKTILCPIGAADSEADLASVIALCAHHGAHLTALLVELAPPMPIAIEVPLTDHWVQQMNQARALLGERGKVLESRLHGEGLSADVQAIVCEPNMIDNLVGLHGRFADLAVAPIALKRGSHIRERILDGVLFEAGKPLLVLPDEQSSDDFILAPETVLVAWDGGLPASRTIMHAIGLLKSAKAVHILCVDPDTDDNATGPAPGWDLGSYLSRHDINITVTQLPSGGLATDVVLARHATEVGAELIVMGAYGHSRLRERIFGGATRGMLDKCPVPLFIAH